MVFDDRCLSLEVDDRTLPDQRYSKLPAFRTGHIDFVYTKRSNVCAIKGADVVPTGGLWHKTDLHSLTRTNKV